MPSTYSPDLRIELIANGEQSGTWGTTTNSNLGTLIEDAISGRASVAVTSANQPLTAFNGAADQARCAAIDLSIGVWPSPSNFNVYVPPVTKLYVVRNTDATYTATVYCSTVLGNTTAAGTGVTIPAGKSVLLRSDGTNIFEQLNTIVGSFNVVGNTVLGGTTTMVGDATAPTQTSTDNSTKVATTAFVKTAVGAALQDPGSNGVLVRTAASTTVARTITAGTGISITNGDGVSGNPTITNSGVTSLNGSTGAVSAYRGLMTVFPSSGVWTIPAGVTSCKVTVVGGGGAGGNSTSTSGSGGGGGGTAIKILTGLTPGNTLTVTVGLGGASASAAGQTSSVTSGTQIISTIQATGGGGGGAGGSNASGGIGTGGDLNIGGNAGSGNYNSGTAGGSGGSSFLGGGGASGSPGRPYGGGGGATGGAAGAAGVVIFEY